MHNILTSIPDKRIDKNTTSLKFKKDLINFFKNKNVNTCLEVGTNKGWTTKVLSSIFQQVHTIEIDRLLVEQAKVNNKEASNIRYHNIDATKKWNLDVRTFNVIFIDCIHSMQAVLNDIEQSLTYYPKYLVFDDYGLPENNPSVKEAVQHFISSSDITESQIVYIGEPAGSQPRIGRTLVDWEGVIITL